MKDVILWTAVLGPFLLAIIVAAYAWWELRHTPAEEHGRYAAIDAELTRCEARRHELGYMGRVPFDEDDR